MHINVDIWSLKTVALQVNYIFPTWSFAEVKCRAWTCGLAIHLSYTLYDTDGNARGRKHLLLTAYCLLSLSFTHTLTRTLTHSHSLSLSLLLSLLLYNATKEEMGQMFANTHPLL